MIFATLFGFGAFYYSGRETLRMMEKNKSFDAPIGVAINMLILSIVLGCSTAIGCGVGFIADSVVFIKIVKTVTIKE